MVALGRIIQATEDLGTLRDLAELINNPDKIIEAHETARKQQALTEEQAMKVAEAKDFIAKHLELQKALDARESKLAQDREVHEKDKVETEAIFQSESKKLSELEKNLKAKTAEQLDTDSQHSKERKKLDDYKKELDTDHVERIRQLDIREKAASIGLNANAAEAQRLALYETKLKAKFAKFQEAAAI